LNRLDDIAIFQPLTAKEIKEIVKLQLAKVTERLLQKEIKLTVTDKAINYFASAGYDEVFGARPLKRLIQTELLDLLSMEIIQGKLPEGSKVDADFDGRKISLKPVK
jgi:ATP-dependent Clp protease ATP-binding subunit ClpB